MSCSNLRRIILERMYWFIRYIFSLLFNILYKIQVVGLENSNIPAPFIVVCNHISILDFPIIMTVFPRRAWALAAENYKHHLVLGPILRILDVVFIRRQEVDRSAIQKAIFILKSGGILALHPEGTRSLNGKLQKAKEGVAFLAINTGVPIVPVSITGTEKFIESIMKLRRETVTVSFGKAFLLPTIPKSDKREALAFYTHIIMLQIASLLPEEYRGEYGVQGESLYPTTLEPPSYV